MGQQKSLSAKLAKAKERLRDDGLGWTLLHYMKRAGIEIRLFYYIKELLPTDIPGHLTALPEGFECATFSLEEVMAISKLPEREDYIHEGFVVDNFNKGDTCLGIKYKGEIAAFSWIALDKVRTRVYAATMQTNEAYLFDMYVLKAFRGKNLAPILRYKNYELLKSLGRDIFYSVTEYSNKASFRFKQKLGAKIVFLGLHVELFHKWHKMWVLKKY